MHIGVLICISVCVPKRVPLHRCLSIGACVVCFRERAHAWIRAHRRVHVTVCGGACTWACMCGHDSVWSGACTWVCPYVHLCVCVCASKRAWLGCIHMGICVCVHTCKVPSHGSGYAQPWRHDTGMQSILVLAHLGRETGIAVGLTGDGMGLGRLRLQAHRLQELQTGDLHQAPPEAPVGLAGLKG